jgi:predicted SprT family Zn-dependent metalloprotease
MTKEVKNMKRNRYVITDARVLTIISSCVSDMKNWGFKLPREIKFYSAECSSRLGLATYSDNSVTLSSFLFKESQDDNIRNTVYHELAHLVAGPGTHHGPKWQAVAKVITEKTGLKIERLAKTANYEYFQSEEYSNKYKYSFKCSGCGVEIHYQKKTQFVNTYADTIVDRKGVTRPRWTCSRCGGTFHKI